MELWQNISMKKIFNFLIILIILHSCGTQNAEKKDVAAATCNIISEDEFINGGDILREINIAREKIGEDLYLGNSNKAKEYFSYDLCPELVLNQKNIDEIMAAKKNEEKKAAEEKQKAKENQIAEDLKIAAKERKQIIAKNKLFFEKNKQIDGVFEVERGLQYTVLEYGEINSTSPNLSDTITAHFHGTLTDGTVFWSSVDSNEPLTVPLSGLIEGCQKVISLMKRGDKWKVFIDPAMAYGDEGRPGIPPNSILVFDIKLLGIN